MPNFIAIKIHYDHRKLLPAHLKYSRVVTAEEHQEYLALYREEGIGGDGFHECLNFSIPEKDTVRIYIPPTCLPGKNRLEDDFIIFSFTYQQDREMPSCIVGVHAGTHVIGRDGRLRPNIHQIPGVDNLRFHAEAPADFSTLFTPPVQYDARTGRHTPEYRLWGYGLRYITENHAQNIIQDAFAGARIAIMQADGSRRLAIEREIEVLTNISRQYNLLPEPHHEEMIFHDVGENRNPPMPDKELGILGEGEIFKRELAYVKEFGLETSLVEWVSQAIPLSPYDIKTIRKSGEGYFNHYLEVKSSKAENDQNIYISSGQVEFMEAHENCSSVVIVRFNTLNEVQSIRYLSLSELRNEFHLIPIKYKLRSREDN